MSRVRWIAFFCVFVTQSVWLALVSRHYGPVAVWLIFFASFLVVISTLWRHPVSQNVPATMMAGLLAGFLAGVAAAFGAECMHRGMDVFDRPYPLANFYFFPLLCGGWLSGPVFLALAGPAALKRRNGTSA